MWPVTSAHGATLIMGQIRERQADILRSTLSVVARPQPSLPALSPPAGRLCRPGPSPPLARRPAWCAGWCGRV